MKQTSITYSGDNLLLLDIINELKKIIISNKESVIQVEDGLFGDSKKLKDSILYSTLSGILGLGYTETIITHPMSKSSLGMYKNYKGTKDAGKDLKKIQVLFIDNPENKYDKQVLQDKLITGIQRKLDGWNELNLKLASNDYENIDTDTFYFGMCLLLIENIIEYYESHEIRWFYIKKTSIIISEDVGAEKENIIDKRTLKKNIDVSKMKLIFDSRKKAIAIEGAYTKRETIYLKQLGLYNKNNTPKAIGKHFENLLEGKEINANDAKRQLNTSLNNIFKKLFNIRVNIIVSKDKRCVLLPCVQIVSYDTYNSASKVQYNDRYQESTDKATNTINKSY